ncbi:MAG: Ig-like domain-containing protein [Pseudomonadota bacterium]|nr:Ig-like domain-containing protein [Pseudomonadota bacterium]
MTPHQRAGTTSRRRSPGRALPAAFLGAALAALGGCTLAPAAPTIAEVSPGWGYNGEPTEISIDGAHFFPTVVVANTNEGASADGGRIEGTFQAWLEGDETFALEDVQHQSYDRLGAEVPEGLPIGTYDLRVEVPSGLVATLPDAFTVTDTRSDHLDVSVEIAAYIVGGLAQVTLQLQDPEDQVVAQALDVIVRASSTTSPTGATDVLFWPTDGLEDQEPLQEGVGITGQLGADGTGVFLVTSQIADDVRFEVSAADETSVVRGDSLTLSWDAGPVSEVELALPRDDFRTLAGDPFDLTIRLKDSLGNVLTTLPADLVLYDECGGWVKGASIVGEGTVEVLLTGACEVDRIHALLYGIVWDSEPFEVLPGEHSAYTVQAAPDSVAAGEGLVVFVEAVDGWGNVVTDHEADILLHDGVGVLDPTRGRGTQSCPGFGGDGSQLCTAAVWTAGSEVVIRAEDAEGAKGEAAPIEVVPADGASVVFVVRASSVEAGESFDVTVRVLDAYANSVGFDPGGTDRVEFLDDSGTLACTWTGAVDGAQGFSCTIEGAVSDANVSARVLGLTGYGADPLVVTNAALGDVEVDPQGSTFVAGTAFTLELRGYDDYGNPYIVQTDAQVDLTDTAGTMTPATAVLGPLGEVQVSSVVYAAGTSVRLSASQGGTTLGTSRPIFVSPDEQDGITVEAPPWISVDEPGVVVLTAVDAYGNTVTSYAGTMTVSSQGPGCETRVIEEFDEGTTSVDLTCETALIGETLVVTDDAGFEGASATVDIVDLACADGPTATLLLDGLDDTVRCLAAGGTVEVEADAAGSTAGGGGLSVWHFSDGVSVEERTLASDTTLTYDTTGTRYVELLVADTNACAGLDGGYVYVGSDDGEPTGPIGITVTPSSVSSIGTVSVDVSALDCTEDIAAGQTLLVRADLGNPIGASSGKGLSVTLDAAGTASFDWTFDAGFSGTGTLYVGSQGGGGIGSKSVTVTDDRVLPTVVSVDPAGTELGTVEQVEVVFSEPMHASFVTSAYISLTGPTAAVTATYALSSDLTTLTITPTTPLDGASGTFTLSLTRDVRDLAGNRLDGGWSGVGAPATFLFGDIGDTLPAVSSCTVDEERFTPDGDDGPDAEKDTIAMTPTATAAPTWWWLGVYDVGGTRVRSERAPGTDSEIEWDGRGDDGTVMGAGWYRLALSAIDTNGNVGGQCNGAVELEQHVDLP